MRLTGFSYASVLGRAARFVPVVRQSIAVAFLQGLWQLLGMLSGLIAVRFMPAQQYALYSIAFAMLGTLSVLADAGVSAGVMAYAGRVWPERSRVGSVVASGFAIRRQLLLATAAVVVPALGYLLLHHGASRMEAACMLVMIAAAGTLGMSAALWEVPPKLAFELGSLQRIQIENALLRLLASGLAGLVLATAPAFVAVGTVSQLIMNVRLKGLASRFADVHAKVDAEARAFVAQMTRRSLPGAVYYCIAGQMPIWIMTVFGSTARVAEVGALSRLGLILSAMVSVLGLVVAPRFARQRGAAAVLLRRYVQVQALVAALAVLVVLGVAAFPHAALALLGGRYQGLTSEVVLLAAAQSAGMVSATAFTLNNARGVAGPGFLSPVVSTIVMVASYFVFDLTSVGGVLLMTMAMNLASILQFNLTYFHYWRRSAG